MPSSSNAMGGNKCSQEFAHFSQEIEYFMESAGVRYLRSRSISDTKTTSA